MEGWSCSCRKTLRTCSREGCELRDGRGRGNRVQNSKFEHDVIYGGRPDLGQEMIGTEKPSAHVHMTTRMGSGFVLAELFMVAGLVGPKRRRRRRDGEASTAEA